MRRYPSPRRSGQLVLGERGEDNAGADRVDSRATFAPPDSLGHHPQRIPALGQLVGVEGVGHLVGCEHGQPEQFLGRRRGTGGVLFGGQCAETVSGLWGDDDPGAAARDDVAEFLEYQGCSVEVHGEDRRRRSLAAWMTPVMSPQAVAVWTSAWTDSREDTPTVAVLTSNPALVNSSAAASALPLVQVGQQDVLAKADPPGDCLTDLPGSDDNNDFTHDHFLHLLGVYVWSWWAGRGRGRGRERGRSGDQGRWLPRSRNAGTPKSGPFRQFCWSPGVDDEPAGGQVGARVVNRDGG
jgi:hypothetical protein